MKLQPPTFQVGSIFTCLYLRNNRMHCAAVWLGRHSNFKVKQCACCQLPAGLARQKTNQLTNKPRDGWWRCLLCCCCCCCICAEAYVGWIRLWTSSSSKVKCKASRFSLQNKVLYTHAHKVKKSILALWNIQSEVTNPKIKKTLRLWAYYSVNRVLRPSSIAIDWNVLMCFFVFW